MPQIPCITSLPVSSQWKADHLAYLDAMQKGLASIGVGARVDTIGSPSMALGLLRVPCSHSSIEAAERWLLATLQPHEASEWAGNVMHEIHRRRREYPLLAASRRTIDRITAHAEQAIDAGERWRLGPSWQVAVHSDRRVLACFARSAMSIVPYLPGVRVVGPELYGSPWQWLAIGVAHDAAGVAELVALGEGLRSMGNSVCRHEWNEGRSTMIAIDAGDLEFDRFEELLEEQMPKPVPAWAAAYSPWSWETGVWVHRHPVSDGWRLREWLEARLGGPPVDAVQDREESVVLKVAPAHVDRALELLSSFQKAN